MDTGTIDSNLINLMAYVVQIDGTVTNEEINIFNEFLKGRFPEEEAKAIFQGFVSALKERPLLESVLDEVRDSYGEDYHSRLGFVLNLYELISSDGITLRELNTFKTVCSFLSIKEEDADLITSLFIPAYQYEFAGNLDRKLSAGEDPERFDLVYPGVTLEWIFLGGRYYVSNLGSSVSVFVNDTRLHDKRIMELPAGAEMTFSGGTVRTEDLSELFLLKRKGEERTLYYMCSGDALERSLEEEAADFRLEVSGPRLRLYTGNDNEAAILVGERRVDEFIYLQLSDSLVINNRFSVTAKDLLYPGEKKKFAAAISDGRKNKFIISDSVDSSDIYIDDETEYGLHIQADREKKDRGYKFRLSFVELPYPVSMGGKYFEAGDTLEIEENGFLLIGRNHLYFDCGGGSIEAGEINFHSFRVSKLSYRFPNGKLGIDEISFSVEKGDLVSIMGASGSGKSTLLQLLLGYLTPTKGDVTINRRDFHENFDLLRNYIGYVPQDDLLMENLTVYENLLYTAKIRLPGKSKKEVDYLIDTVLKNLGLQDKKYLSVGSPVDKVLSGGQRKRLNIGLELLADPDLFFLDEPTSGLSSGDSESIIRLLSDLADRGKIVFVVIHQPSSDIYKRFDKLLLLDVGGKLAYFGGAMEGIRYFKQFLPVKDNFIECPSCGNANPELIFNVLEQKELGKDGRPLYVEREDFGKGFAGLLRRAANRPVRIQEPVRRYDSDYWSRLFVTKQAALESSEETETAEAMGRETQDEWTMVLPPKPARGPVAAAAISGAYFARNLRDKLKDRSNMVMTLGAPFLLGLLMSLLLRGGETPYLFPFNEEFTKYHFLSVIIFVFFGLMSSVNEVIKDRPILHREKIIGTRPRQYLFSKIGVYSLFAVPQVVLYVLPGFFILRIPWRLPPELGHLAPFIGGGAFLPYFLITGFFVVYASYALGIFLSSLVKSQLAAFNLIPLIIVPQILFGGMFISFQDMPGLINKEVPAYANLTFSRWGYEALLSGSEVYNPLYSVTDTEEIKNIQKKFEKQGREWDYQKEIGTPLQKMKKEPAGVLPEKLSYDIYKEHFKDYIYKNDPGLWERVQTLFALDESGDFVTLSNVGNKEDTRLVQLAFRAASPDGFYNRYQLFMGNRGVRDAVFKARSLSWMEKLSAASSYRPMDWAAGQNIFPAHEKIWGLYRFSTVFFNLAVLLLLAFLLHIAAALRLRRL